MQFTDLSTNATGWSWDFGDGTNSTHQNLTHTYSTAGTYIVNLTVNNSNGTDSKLAKIQCLNTPAENYSCVAAWSLPGHGYGPVGYYDPTHEPYNIPIGVAIASSGNIYVADRENNSVLKLDSNGNIITRWGSYGNATGQFNSPKGVAVDSSGYVYVIDSINHRIQKFDSNGKFITTWGSYGDDDGQFDNGPDSIAVDSSGNVYVAGNGPDRIQKFDSNGKFLSRIGIGNVDDWIYRPYGIAVDTSGNIYVVDGEGNCVYELNSTGGFVRDFGTNGGLSPGGDGKLGGPSGVAVDSLGNVYISDNYDIDYSSNLYGSQIHKFNNTGSFITRWGSYGNDTGQFYETGGIAVDPSGYVYVTDRRDNRLEKFASDKPIVKPIIPVANFSANATIGYVPLSVQFNDSSSNASGLSWDFGDKTTSNNLSPTHTYFTVGNYIVNLTASNGNGSDSKLAAINVLAPLPKPDIEKPVIQSAILFPANTTAGSKINITVNATDNIGVVGVTAGNAPMVNINGIWQGSITAPSKIGSYSLSINASDTTGNIGKISVPYKVVQLQGGANIAVSPRSSSVAAGNKVTLAIKVKNTQNIDDTFKVRISVSELPATYQGNLTWFDWTDNVASLRSGQEVQVPMEVNIPAGATKGRKLFRANVLAGTSKISGFDTGYLVIA